MGWENVFHCDKEKSCRDLLKNYWQNSASLDDIFKCDFTIYKNKIDVLTGGDPCQPHSYAGKQKGITDARFLWPEMLRAITIINPVWVVNENVVGTITNGVVDRKISDMENEGYTCWPPLIIPANGVGAIHKRDRVWLVAYSERNFKSREKSCYRKIGRMGRIIKPMAWNRNWEAAINFFRGMDDGLPNIVDRTDGTRNAIIPKIAFHIFKSIKQYDSLVS